MSNQWEDKLRKRMETHQEPQIDGLWDKIEQTLLQENSAKPASKSKRTMLWAKRFAAAAAVLLIALTIGYILMDNEIIDMPQVVELPNEKSPSNTQISPIETNKIEDTAQEKRPLYAEKSAPKNSTTTRENLPNKSVPSTSKTEKIEQENEVIRTSIDEKTVEETLTPDKADKTDKSEKVENKSPDQTRIETLPTEQDYYIQPKIKRGRNSNLRTNLYVSNLSPNSNDKFSGYNDLSAYKMTSEHAKVGNEITATPYEMVQLENQYKEIYTNIEHKQPIVVGATVNYNINERWSLRSGLTYSLLSSDLHSGSDNNYYYSDQTLHYIGIPLNINYNVWSNNKLVLYASAGGMMQKNVSGKLATDYIVNNKIEHSEKKNISVDGLQWSLNTSIGIQYNISDRIGLYFEPGVSYYLENKSPVETIYKERPFNLNLNIGLSFSLNGK